MSVQVIYYRIKYAKMVTHVTRPNMWEYVNPISGIDPIKPPVPPQCRGFGVHDVICCADNSIASFPVSIAKQLSNVSTKNIKKHQLVVFNIYTHYICLQTLEKICIYIVDIPVAKAQHEPHIP